MPLSFAQYETLYNDATLQAKLKVLAVRMLRDFLKTSTDPNKELVFTDAMAKLNSSAFLDRVRIEMLGELDDAGVSVPSAADLAQAAKAALRSALKRNDL